VVHGVGVLVRQRCGDIFNYTTIFNNYFKIFF
jgi:hypothetical protein